MRVLIRSGKKMSWRCMNDLLQQRILCMLHCVVRTVSSVIPPEPYPNHQMFIRQEVLRTTNHLLCLTSYRVFDMMWAAWKMLYPTVFLVLHVYSLPSELYQPSDRSLSAKLVPTFAGRGRHVSTADPYYHVLGFPDMSLYFFFQVAPQLCSLGWVALFSRQLNERHIRVLRPFVCWFRRFNSRRPEYPPLLQD
jgi:hypothetical protein